MVCPHMVDFSVFSSFMLLVYLVLSYGFFFFLFFFVVIYYVVFFFFFFSSRRRHTRCLSDWSSDVCSSDLRARDTADWAGRTSPPTRPAHEVQAAWRYRAGRASWPSR